MVTLLLFLLAAVCFGVMNTLQFHHDTSIFAGKGKGFWIEYSFWGSKSYDRKYKMYRPSASVFFDKPLDNWYYRTFKIPHKESFPLSATLLVFLTDGYHFLQFIMLWSLAFAIAFAMYDGYGSIFYHALVVRVIWGVGWNVAYTVTTRK